MAVTKRDGTFVIGVHPAPAQLFQYRARVNQTKRCRAATSKSVTIKAV